MNTEYQPISAHAEPMIWTPDRKAELAQLQLMLQQLASLNAGSGAIDKLPQCIAAAKALQINDMETGRDSFFNFLVKQVANRPPPTSTHPTVPAADSR